MAADAHHLEVMPAHLALALIEQKDGIVPTLITSLGASNTDIIDTLTKNVQLLPTISQPQVGRASTSLQKVLNAGEAHAGKLHGDGLEEVNQAPSGPGGLTITPSGVRLRQPSPA